MTSILRNSSLSVYIGNIASLDDQSLPIYCSRFGTVISCSIDDCPREQRPFCDFRIVEFANKRQLDNFLSVRIHQIGTTILDVKLFTLTLRTDEILNVDRKLFVGPVIRSTDVNTIVQFYKTIDPTVQYSLSRHDNQTYVLLQFANRQYVTTIFEQKTRPILIENQQCSIYKAVHPKQLIHRITQFNSIWINGLTDKISESVLIDYFEKRATVVACHIQSTDPKWAIIEFDNEKAVSKLLETPVVRLQGVSLSVSKVPDHLVSLPSSSMDEEDEIHTLLEAAVQPSSSALTESAPLSLEPTQQENVHKQPQPVPFMNLPPPPAIPEPLPVPPPDNIESGWASPPRSVVSYHPSSDQGPVRSSSKPCATTASITADPSYRSTIIDSDSKPTKKNSSTNNFLRFIEQFQSELEQIKDDYIHKFAQDRNSIEQEITRIIIDERQTFEQLNRYLLEHRRRYTKRKRSPSTATMH